MEPQLACDFGTGLLGHALQGCAVEFKVDGRWQGGAAEGASRLSEDGRIHLIADLAEARPLLQPYPQPQHGIGARFH